MTDDEEDTPPRRRGFIASAIYGSPRNLFMTLGTLFIIGTMISNSLNPKDNYRSKTRSQVEQEKPRPAAAGRVTEDPPPLPAAEAAGGEARITPQAGHSEAAETRATAREAEVAASHTRDALARLEMKIAAQEETIAALNREWQNVAALRSRIDAMETSAGRKLASLTLFGQLREAAQRGDPFKPQLDQLLELNKNSPRINALLIQLLPAAGTGLHSAGELQAEFTGALDAALQQGHGDFRAQLGRLIRIRRIGAGQPGMDDESVLARAEAALAGHDIRTALRTLDALSAGGRNAMAAWIRSAQEYAAAQDTLSALQLALAYTAPAAPAAPASANPEPQTAAPAKEEEAAAPQAEQKTPQAAPRAVSDSRNGE